MSELTFHDGSQGRIKYRFDYILARRPMPLRVIGRTSGNHRAILPGKPRRMGKPAHSIFKMKELIKDGVVRHVIGDEAAGQRIDNFLVRICKGVPKSHLYRILREGQVRVNSRRIGPDYRLCSGDEVRMPPLRRSETSHTSIPAGKPFETVYEDDFLAVVDKPPGVAVHGGSGVSFGIIEQLRRQRPEARFLELAHRLDRETSGLLLVAKKRAALTRLHEQFRRGEVEKRYLALVRGRWLDQIRHIRLPLQKRLTAEGERRVSVDAAGKEAHSIVRLVARWENFSLVEVQIETGRTHQIRVHLAHHGFPLCGDDKYGDFPLNKMLKKQGLDRMFLHAACLATCHPVTGEALRLAAPLPPDLAGFLARLEHNEQRDYGAKVPTRRI